MTACKQAPPAIEFQLFANGEKVLSILPEDIAYYDTTQERSGIEIHELRLRKGFFKVDSFILTPPLFFVCKMDHKDYYSSEFFHSNQSEPSLMVNFKFRSSCENEWTFQEQTSGKLILRTKNKCNSIELFHRRDAIRHGHEQYYEKKEYFKNYIDTARLAHEILYDPYYLNALKAAGIQIK